MHLTGRKSRWLSPLPLSSLPSLPLIIQQDYAKRSTPPKRLKSGVVALEEVGQMQIVANSFTQRINAQQKQQQIATPPAQAPTLERERDSVSFLD